MANKNKNSKDIFSTIVEDIRNGGFRSDFSTDWQELKDTLLSRQRIQQLEQIPRYRRSFHSFWWLLEKMILILRPVRRLLLILCIIVLILSIPNLYGVNTPNITFLASLILLVLLMLELKDKLLAHNELDAGRVVQTAMLPDESPDFPGYEIWLYSKPAKDVGGDLIDYIRVDDNKCCVACGDVAGKGLEAALFMVKLQSSLRSLSNINQSLENLAKRINEIFYYDRMRNKFASLIFFNLFTDSGKIDLLNAGHMQPIILRNDGQTEELPKVSPAIGIMRNAPFKSQQADLEEGEYFIVYSDGITEAVNDFGDFFGNKRFIKLLNDLKGSNAKAVGDEVITRLEKFMGLSRAHDDISLAIIRRTNKKPA